MFTPQDRYPTGLEPVRRRVLDTLTDIHEIGRISNCKGYLSQCRSIFCPNCSNGETFRLLGRVRGACDSLPEPNRNNLKFLTLTTRDVPVAELRAVSEASRAAVL